MLLCYNIYYNINCNNLTLYTYLNNMYIHKMVYTQEHDFGSIKKFANFPYVIPLIRQF